MSPCLTFIIPIRHQDNAPNWDNTLANLQQTISSIAAQKEGLWRCIIVANYGAELPNTPQGFDICRVDFPPNVIYEQGNSDKNDFYEAVRFDKGRRILAGILYAKEIEYLMVVDDDDLIHCDLATYVSAHMGENGWYIKNGYVWADGGKLMMNYSEFHHFCGTSHIVRKDLLKLPDNFEDADMGYVKNMLGSHRHIKDELDNCGKPLLPIPFLGAVYRIGNRDSHSKTPGLFQHFFKHKWLLKEPRELIRRIMCLRILNASKRATYFGQSA